MNQPTKNMQINNHHKGKSYLVVRLWKSKTKKERMTSTKYWEERKIWIYEDKVFKLKNNGEICWNCRNWKYDMKLRKLKEDIKEKRWILKIILKKVLNEQRCRRKGNSAFSTQLNSTSNCIFSCRNGFSEEPWLFNTLG